MSYTPNLPNTGQSLGFTRQPIQDNFTNYFNVMSVNHVAPNDSGQGKHAFLQMPEQGSAPTTAANEGGLYTAQGTGSTTQLFWVPENNGTPYQLTGVSPVTGSNGYSVLPGGLYLQWGNLTMSSNATTGATFPIEFPTACFVVIPGIQVPPAPNSVVAPTVVSGTVTKTGFNARVATPASSYTVTFSYIAIGN